MNSEYGLLVSFPDQSETFVLGFEAGQLWEVLKSGSGDMAYSLTMHTANEEVFTRIARHYGCTAEFKRLEGGWSEATLRRSSKPKLQLVRPSQETPAESAPIDLLDELRKQLTVPPGHFWRGEPEANRHQCRNCGEHYDRHLHTDESSTCPTANRVSATKFKGNHDGN